MAPYIKLVDLHKMIQITDVTVSLMTLRWYVE